MTELCTPTPRRPATGPEAGETVHVITWRLLDRDGDAETMGGLQRWLRQLCGLLLDLGHPVVVHQKAARSFCRELRPGLQVRGHRARARSLSTPGFNLRVHRHIPAEAAVVYMAEDLSFPILRQRSLLIQHGVWWDGEFGPLHHRAVQWLAQRAMRRAQATICVDTNALNWLRAHRPRAAVDERLHYIPNFIDPAEFGAQPTRPAAAAPADGSVQVLFPRRSEPRRGIYLMAEVMPRLLRRHRHLRVRFLVGSGHHTEALRDALVRAGADLSRCRIESLGLDEMAQAYRQSQIVTIPTICGEGTSLSALEAMHAGCAVVASWVGGLCNLIQDGHNGLQIAPCAADLERALERLILDDRLREELGQRAMQEALPRYGIQAWRDAVRTVLCGTLGLGVRR